MGDDGFLEKLRRRRKNLGLLMVEEYCGVLGDAVAAARRRRGGGDGGGAVVEWGCVS